MDAISQLSKSIQIITNSISSISKRIRNLETQKRFFNGVSILRSAAMSIPTASLTVVSSFDVEDYDTNSYYTIGDEYILIPDTGYYSIIASGFFTGHATDDTGRRIDITINGTNYVQQSCSQDVNTGDMYLNICVDAYLSVDDEIRIACYQDCGGALNFNSARLMIKRLR
jgi:hypothetical protein